MPSYPKINTGLGKLTPGLWSRLMGMLRWFEAKGRTELDNQPGVKRPYILAKITGSALIVGTKRWKYAWTEVILDGSSSTTFIDKPGGLSGTTVSNWALNLCEAVNTTSSVGPGIRLNGSGYPASFDIMPLGGLFDDGAGTGTVEMVTVLMLMRDDDGGLRYFANVANSNDGGCA